MDEFECHFQVWLSTIIAEGHLFRLTVISHGTIQNWNPEYDYSNSNWEFVLTRQHWTAGLRLESNLSHLFYFTFLYNQDTSMQMT